jgi:hypothetical protein
MVWLTAMAGTVLSVVFVARHMPWVGVVLFAHTWLFVGVLRAAMKRPVNNGARSVQRLVFLLGLMTTLAPDAAAILKSLA